MDPVALLFAQQGRPPQFGGSEMAVLIGQCAGALVGILVQILYLLSLFKAFGKISARNRTMEPGMVFLSLIPLFNLVWNFFVVIRLAESLKNEYRDRGWRSSDEGFGYGAGMTYAIGSCICCGPVALVGLIMHWVQIAGYSGKLDEGGGRKRRSRVEEDEDEAPPRKRRRRAEEEDDEES